MSALRKFWLSCRRQFRVGYRMLAAGLRQTSRLIGRPFQQLWAWGRGRSWLYFLQGLPALGGTVAVGVLVALWMALPTHEVEARYQDRAGAATKAKDYALARVCYERLATLGQDRPENLYEMAVALEALGQGGPALEIMTQLAPIDHTGYGPAHLWMALHHWKRLGDPRDRKRAETHLTSALKAGLPNAAAAHGLLGELYWQSGKPELAEPHLEHAIQSRPHVRLRYAQVLAAQNKKPHAIHQANLAASYFKTRAQADSTDHVARLGWAEAVTFLEEFPQALAILSEGHHLSNERGYQVAMANTVFTWHLFVVRTQPDNVALQWNLLEKGLQLDSTHVRLLDRLVHLIGKGGADAEKARQLMNKVLASGEATATSHFLLGMDAWQQGDAAKAEVHWESALKLSPNLPMVANNLAWLLAHRKDADLPRALELSNRVIAKFPDNPGYRDTRARIYLKQSRWRDAQAEFEGILARYPNYPAVHSGLAEVYAQLGMQGVAAEHRRLHDAAEKKRAAKQ